MRSIWPHLLHAFVPHGLDSNGLADQGALLDDEGAVLPRWSDRVGNYLKQVLNSITELSTSSIGTSHACHHTMPLPLAWISCLPLYAEQTHLSCSTRVQMVSMQLHRIITSQGWTDMTKCVRKL